MPDEPRNRLLNRNIRLFLGAAGLLASSLFGGYAVLMNLFILRLDFGPGFVGLVNGIGLICWAVAAPLARPRANRFGPRRLMAIGLGCVFAGGILLPFGADLVGEVRSVWIVASYSLASAGVGIFFVNFSPFIMGSVAPRLRNRAFALAHAAFPTSGFAGSLVGGFLPGVFAGLLGVGLDDPAAYCYPLHLVVLIVLPGVFLIARTTDVARVERGPPGVSRSRVPIFALAAMTFLGILRPFGESSIRTFFNIYMDSGLGVDTAIIGTTFALSQLLVGPIALLSPLISSRIGTVRTTLLATIGITVSLIPVAVIGDPTAAVIGLITVFAFTSIMRPALAIYQMELVRPEFWGPMSGFLNLSWALGYSTLFFTGAVLSAIAALLYGAFLIVHRPLPAEEVPDPTGTAP